MLKKLIFAAAAVASVVTLASVPAKADPDFFFGIGFGGDPGFHHPHPDFYPSPYHPDYYPPPPEPVYYPEPYHHHHHHFDDAYYSGVSCGGGANILRHSGFRGVSADDCSGSVYSYQAWKHGEQFDVQVSDRGRIISVDPAY